MAASVETYDAIIAQITDALQNRPAGVVTIRDPLGGETQFSGVTEMANALEKYEKLRKDAEMEENGRSAMVIGRRKPR